MYNKSTSHLQSRWLVDRSRKLAPRGKVLADTQLTVDEYGAADYNLSLKKEARVGDYLIQVDKDFLRKTAKFKVEEYRVPTFMVSLENDDEALNPGDNANVLIKAEYLHGEALGGRKVNWSVYRQYETFSSPSYPGYRVTVPGIM